MTKNKILFPLLLLACLLALIIPSHSHEGQQHSAIDAIIKRNYQQYIQSQVGLKPKQLRSTTTPRSSLIKGYQCQHDIVMNRFRDKLNSLAANATEQVNSRYFYFEISHLIPISLFWKIFSLFLPETQIQTLYRWSFPSKLQQSVEQAHQPIRITADYSLLSGETDSFACFRYL